MTAEDERARLAARVRKLELEVKDLQKAFKALALAVHGQEDRHGPR